MELSKCFCHLESFLWKQDSTWEYDKNKNNKELQLLIPLLDGTVAPIEHCGVDEAPKTLGLMTYPSGLHEAAITNMKERAQGWIDQAKLANLLCHNLWFLLGSQFMPKVMYGIGVDSAPYTVLSECLMKQYYNMAPLGGVWRSANRMVQQLNKGFFGVGCPHAVIECLASQATMLLTHFGCEKCSSPIAASLCGAFHTRAWHGRAILSDEFSWFGGWVMETWVNSLWEKVFLFGIILEEGKLQIVPTRKRNEWLMPLLCKLGYSSAELLRQNRVQIYQEVLFLLYIMGMRGTVVDDNNNKS